ncbi:HHL088Wp [Eremothecium sinecaudum]|uniref:HHL088Wp n=1 Tax=Eremothecium sinecaudum TaxID=45286 RepID=A0A109UYI6_9SACH|nr:HHL088Wp [Eremothecium sinecaudum]AMD22682.1 HHL088Wp [Eremothecium sinecaudum]
MSLFMDEMDHQYIKALFPQYLLQQPIAHDLWKLYYKHKKLFNKLKVKRQVIAKGEDFSELSSYTRANKLNYTTRKVIWEKLSQLGVLGIIPYDSATDEYLIQVYKYFYTSRDSRFLSLSDRKVKENADGSGNVGEVSQQVENDDEDVVMNEGGQWEGAHEEVGGEDGDAEEYEQSSDILPSDSEQSGATGSHGHSPDSEERVGFEGDDDSDTFYPAVTESKHAFKTKPNPLSADIYSTLAYPLPHKWVTQSNNSVLVSPDGFTSVRLNPNWQPYPGYDNNSIVNNRLRTSVNNQKQQWASTWANTYICHKRVAIFYFEVRILSVTSSQSGQTCNINIGLKDWSKINNSADSHASDPPSRDNADISTLNRQTTNILRGAFDGSRPGSQHSDAGKDVYAYNGSDGYINDGSKFKSYSKPYGRDDVIGCGVNFVDSTIFFTKNGIHLGTAFKDISQIDLVPYISLRAANSVRTNFGLYEEFLFDIIGYQNYWKSLAYQHIFDSISGGAKSEFEFDDEGDDNDEHSDDATFSDTEDVPMLDTDCVGEKRGNVVSSAGSETDRSIFKSSNTHSDKDGFLLSRDTRFNGDRLFKPDKEKLNSINDSDDSIPCTLNSMINDYLIHKGLISVAKGFLADLQKDCIPNNEEERNNLVIARHERQIKKEEENLRIRQDLRGWIKNGDIPHCIKYIENKFPGLLSTNVELAFEFKVAEYLLAILKLNETSIDFVLQKGLEISNEFIYNSELPDELREKFKTHFAQISALMAYDNPQIECSKDLAVYLTPAYLQDRLFQLVNTSILTFLKKNSESSLENMISYTRAMTNTLLEYGDQLGSSGTEADGRFYKLVNIDEDLLGS